MNDGNLIHTDKELIFIQINVHSLLPKINEITYIAETYRADIIAIQETWLLHSETPYIKGYSQFGCSRNARSGGCGLFIKSDIEFNAIEATASDGAEQSRILLTKLNIEIISFYRKPNSNPYNISSLNNLNLNRSMIIGDFNAHHHDWSCGKPNKSGQAILDFCKHKNLKIFGSKSIPTLLSTKNTFSSPDFIICGSKLIHRIIKQFTAVDVGSDHIPLVCVLSCKNKINKTVKELKQRESTLNISIYKKELKEELSKQQTIWIEREFNVQSCLDSLCTAILKAVRKNCKQRIKGKNPSQFTDEVERLVTKRRKLRKTLGKKQTLKAALEFNIINKKTKAAIQSAKKQYIEMQCRSANNKTIFRIYKNLFSNNRPPISIKDNNNNNLTSPQSIADSLCEYYNSCIPTQFTDLNKYDDQISNLQNQQHYISSSEIAESIDKLNKNTSPGNDDICAFMIKTAAEVLLPFLKQFFNNIFTLNKYPKSWNDSTIIAIPKTINASSVSDYRPISLTCIFARIIDSIIRNKIQLWCNDNNIIPQYQAGFVTKRNSLEHLIRLQQDSHSALQNKNLTIAIFLDLAKAFDRVPRNLIIQKLLDLKIDKNICIYVKNFLQNRIAKVKQNSTYSQERQSLFGVPQGSPLSPILFNIFCSDALNNCSTNRAQYADDIALQTSSSSIDIAERKLNNDLIKINNQLSKNGQKINVSKCKVIVISNKHKIQKPRIYIAEDRIPVCESAKYLGITIENKLTQRHHLQIVKQKCEKLYQPFLKITKLANERLSIQLYKSVVRPIIEYGSEIWGRFDYTTTKARFYST